MKRFYLMLLALCLLLSLCACQKEPAPEITGTPSPSTSVEIPDSSLQVTPSPEPELPPTPEPEAEVFAAPAGTVVCGVDLGGMTREEALSTLTRAANSHQLTLQVAGRTLYITGQNVGLSLTPSLFDSYWQALETGSSLPEVRFSVNASALESVISGSLETSPRNAAVEYSSNQKKFVVTTERSGMDYDIPTIAGQAGTAMCGLATSCSVNATGRKVAPTVTASDPRLTAAAEEANRYLLTALTYTFTPDGGKTSTEVLGPATIASFVNISKDYTVNISTSAINSFVSRMNSRYSLGNYTDKFKTTGGGTVNFNVHYYGQSIDTQALVNDIYTCMTTGVSGTRVAPYKSAFASSSQPYGGTYIEISLTAQHLWMYKNGECVVSTPIVSGCVASAGRRTPTGVFSISYKTTNAWLTGPTWRDFVHYWMPFYGNYGLHDATWRDTFGGEIYIHEGSHGCPNLPLEAAAQIYEHAQPGTKVIIYGGASKAYDLTQQITGTTSYRVADDTAPFKLDTALKYPGASLTYSSSNPEAASVSEDGTVTVQGQGTATITVTAAPFTYHTGATFTTQITICSVCEDGRHPGQWTQTSAPGCESNGSELFTCPSCGYTDTREIPATGHSFTAENPVCGNNCGAANPNYVVPSPEPGDKAE